MAQSPTIMLIMLSKPNWLSPAVGTPLLMASGMGHEDVVKFLLSKNAKVNAKHATNGFTPLFAATHRGHASIIEILLAAGADPGLTDVNGRKPIDVIGSGTSQVLSTFTKRKIENIFRKYANRKVR